MNQRQAKHLRRIAKRLMLNSPLIVAETDYQIDKYGGLRLRPSCVRSVYQTLKKAVV